MPSISSLIIEISSSSTYGEREKEREIQGDMHNEVTQMHLVESQGIFLRPMAQRTTSLGQKYLTGVLKARTRIRRKSKGEHDQ